MTTQKIMICDDDEGILEMLQLVLNGNNYQAIPVQNSLHVFDAIIEEQPDLLLLDLWMPVVSGDQVLKAIRDDERTAQLPVIVISASRDGQQIAQDYKANDFIAKPFDLNKLLQTIHANL